MGKISAALGFIRDSRRLNPTIAIAVEGDKVSQKFAPLSGPRLTIGPDNRYCKHYSVKLPLDHGQRHVFHDYEAVPRQLTGNALAPGYIALNAPAGQQQKVKAMLREKLPYPDRPYIIIHPCATKDYKQWPTPFFAELADHINAKNINVVITGAGNFDAQTITRLCSLVTSPVLSLHNQLSLGEFIALLQSAVCFVGNDTGPSHLAAACGTPTFTIFGPTDEYLWGPLGDNVKILRSAIACEASCLRRQCDVGYRCMQTLNPASVIADIKTQLASDIVL